MDLNEEANPLRLSNAVSKTVSYNGPIHFISK